MHYAPGQHVGRCVIFLIIVLVTKSTLIQDANQLPFYIPPPPAMVSDISGNAHGTVDVNGVCSCAAFYHDDRCEL